MYKLGATAASLFTLPLMIHYLGKERFGVWSTLLSIVSWVVFFDLGIGKGLRNKLAESLAKGKNEEAAHYIDSAYSLIGMIVLALGLVAIAATFMMPWQSIFNSRAIPESELRDAVILTFVIVSINFWVGLINQVLNAIQKTSAVGFGQLIANSLALLGMYILVSLSSRPSILSVAIIYGFSIVFANMALSVWFYRIRRDFTPSLSLQREHISPLLSLGLRFFIIQCAALVLFTTDKILIAQLLGPAYVTQYDVVFRLFALFTMAHGIISAPLWSAYTDAYHREDMAWIKRTLWQQLRWFAMITVGTAAMIFLAKPVVALWVGGQLGLSMALVISMAVFAIISMWNNVFAHIMNGIGEMRLQMKTAVVGMIANIPLSVLFVKVGGLGVDGIVYATVLSLLPFALLAPFHLRGLLRSVTHEAA